MEKNIFFQPLEVTETLNQVTVAWETAFSKFFVLIAQGNSTKKIWSNELNNKRGLLLKKTYTNQLTPINI